MSDASLRPHVGIASARILDVVVRKGGGYAVLTEAGIDLFDDTLAKRSTIASEATGTLVELADGRFLVYRNGLLESVDGRPFVEINVGRYIRNVIPTAHGFIAVGSDLVVIDHDGERSEIEMADDRLNGGSVAWRGGAAIAGREGLTLLDAEGFQLARSEPSEDIWLSDQPIIAGNVIVAKSLRDVLVFDADARIVDRFEGSRDGLTAFAGGLLVQEDVENEDCHLSFYVSEGGELDERWSIRTPAPWRTYAVGDRVVLASKSSITIVDVESNVRGTCVGQGHLRNAAAFGGGIALDMDWLAWWREGQPLETLEHDVSAGIVRAVPAGLLSTEHDVIFVWRTDVQGPAPSVCESQLPFNTPLVINGNIVTIESAGQFSLRAKTTGGSRVAVRPDGAWRHATSRDEALKICERLNGRVFDRPIPELAREGTYGDNTQRLAQLPLTETVDLYGRTWFAPTSLDAEALPYAMMARSAFLDELAIALGTSPRLLSAAIRARKMKLEPPRPIAGYEYFGTFTSSETLIVADPCYFSRATLPTSASYNLALKLNTAHEGIWHAFARNGTGEESNRTAELVVIHESGFNTYAGDDIGSIGVDGGCAGVFDKACPQRIDGHPLEEGIVHGLGAITWSGFGDGGYTVYVGEHLGRIAKIRIPFIDDAPEIDRCIVKSIGAAKPYSASMTFAAGDTIEHVKFGTGLVIKIGADGKIDVRFADGTRTLIHARKR